MKINRIFNHFLRNITPRLSKVIQDHHHFCAWIGTIIFTICKNSKRITPKGAGIRRKLKESKNYKGKVVLSLVSKSKKKTKNLT